MSVAANKAVARRFIDELINQWNEEALGELFTEDFVDHSSPPGIPPGQAQIAYIWQFGRMVHTAFPDLQYPIESMVAEGDLVVTRSTIRATHLGVMRGVVPTGKQVTWSGMDMFRISGDKISERWADRDTFGLLQQIGVLPSLE